MGERGVSEGEAERVGEASGGERGEWGSVGEAGREGGEWGRAGRETGGVGWEESRSPSMCAGVSIRCSGGREELDAPACEAAEPSADRGRRRPSGDLTTYSR